MSPAERATTNDLMEASASLFDRLSLNQSSAWRELDAIPVPRTTFVDERGLPTHAILADGSVLRPAASMVGRRRLVEDDSEVGEDLRPLKRIVEVCWDGAVPQELRGTRPRTQEEETEMARGYDDAANGIQFEARAERGEGRARIEAITMLRAAGVSVRDIAQRLRLHRSTVIWYIQESRKAA